MSEQLATARPWRVGGHPRDDSGTAWREILTDSLEFRPSYVAQALESDAQLIVIAVNAHDALVEAVRLFDYVRCSGRADLDPDEVAVLDTALARAEPIKLASEDTNAVPIS